MMAIIGYLLIVIGVVLNLNAPAELSYANKLLLVGDCVIMLYVGRLLVNRMIVPEFALLRSRIWNYFVLFVGLVLLYLYICWTPYLSPLSPGIKGWGFDPQRYYWWAVESLRFESFDYGLNYKGVVEIYRFAMSVFGIDPMVPVFVNALAVLFAICSIAGTYIRHGKTFSNSLVLKCLPFLFFIPEIIAYSAMSSREVLSASFSLICLSYTVRYLYGQSLSHLIKAFICIVVLFIVRPPFAITTFIAVVVSMMLCSSRLSKIQKVLFALLLGIGIMSVGIGMNSAMGSAVDVERLDDALKRKIEGGNEKDEELGYSENSFAEKLIPHNPVEFFVFGAIRSATYLIPKSNLISPLLSGTPFIMYGALSNLTGLLFMCLIPVIWWSVRNLKQLDDFSRSVLVFFLLLLSVVGFGIANFIQDRYRIVFDFIFVLFACMIMDKMGGWSYYKRYSKLFFFACVLYVVVFLIR